MRPDLVQPPGLDPAFHQSDPSAATGTDAIMGHRGAAVRIRAGHLAVLKADFCQRLPHNALTTHRSCGGNCQIFLANPAPREILPQLIIRTRRLGKEQQTTARPIQPMQQTEVPIRPQTAQSGLRMRHRRILNRIRGMPHPRQAHLSAGFGHHKDLLVLSDDLQRQRRIGFGISHFCTLAEENRMVPVRFTRSTPGRNQTETFRC